MKSIVSTVPLRNRNTGKFEDATLFRGISVDNLAHIETRWRPLFEIRRREAQQLGQSMADINAEDAHWEWGQKMLIAEKDPLIYDIYVIECGFNTQAVMLVRKGGLKCICRHPDERPTSRLLYVDFLATAPWNRDKLVSDPTYSGCGRILISTAVDLSFEEENCGRIGLHSLPGAEEFYRGKVGMTDLGPDENCYGLRYFEISAATAASMFASPSTSEE
ncbi:hypothetical protein [Rhizobium rhizogenes]|uniref:hypothetical protein n=1 Tax=Rhizobium rhizogenes TaxID=359 RepID=UPI00157244B7|nr:hypothetical protein [Rhizobium rhizogenes]NTG08851.1 GNAT family N-acetyltransferase [Rhizobium rhizogenes]